MILPPHHTFNFLSLSIEKSIKCRTGPGNDFVAICKFGNFPQRLQKQNANDLWDNILQKDKWEADEGLPWSAPQFPSQKTELLPYMGQFLQDGKFDGGSVGDDDDAGDGDSDGDGDDGNDDDDRQV